ncbi:hypothetical protein HCU64_09370 [Methylobacterium sp. C25]|uniref:hypothetical protein n=1 Tax=Methylobacterium sp. C25 TaxID=2721622 RepID=UPI001F410639|nr:hypothetical protein [Methylobacterium sp. C25]MCE4223959.1 hypothetical protein [Methylobacterium sp. C25]
MVTLSVDPVGQADNPVTGPSIRHSNADGAQTWPSGSNRTLSHANLSDMRRKDRSISDPSFRRLTNQSPSAAISVCGTGIGAAATLDT